MNIFEQASREKLRFETAKGYITTEDLWSLPLTSRSTASVSLDDIAKSLNKQIKESSEESFVVKRSTVNELLTLRFEIVKHIIAELLAQKEQAATDAKKREQKQVLAELIAQKSQDNLKEKSLEELIAMHASM